MEWGLRPHPATSTEQQAVFKMCEPRLAGLPR